MKTQNKILISLIVFLLTINLASAELYMWQETSIIKDKNVVRHKAVFQLDDSSIQLFTRAKAVPISIIESTQVLPYNIGSYYPALAPSYVDWCNYTIWHTENFYEASAFGIGVLSNSSVVMENKFYENISARANLTTYQMFDKDFITAIMDCHYTNNNSLFIESVYFGQINANIPAYECDSCKEHTFEELTQENNKIAERIQQEKTLYSNIQKLVSRDYQVWLIMSWFLKIGLIFIAIGLIVLSIYYLYIFFKMIGDRIK